MTHPEEQILKYILKNKIKKISLNTLRVLFGENESLFDVSIVRLDHELNVIKTELNLIGEWDVIVVMPFREIKKLLNPIKTKREKMKKSKPIWESSRGLKIFGNNHDIPIIYGYELSDKWKKEFDYYKGEELDYATFFKYKDWIYDLGEFMRISPNNSPFEECPIKFDGYKSETFFSGILVKFTEDCDFVKVYHYYS